MLTLNFPLTTSPEHLILPPPQEEHHPEMAYFLSIGGFLLVAGTWLPLFKGGVLSLCDHDVQKIETSRFQTVQTVQTQPHFLVVKSLFLCFNSRCFFSVASFGVSCNSRRARTSQAGHFLHKKRGNSLGKPHGFCSTLYLLDSF